MRGGVNKTGWLLNTSLRRADPRLEAGFEQVAADGFSEHRP